MILLIDNYDSFTWNLVQRIGELDSSLDVRVERNDRITPDEVESLSPDHIIISPGPCTPAQAGVSNELVKRFAGQIPILGVCLGHQCIGSVNNMKVVRHSKIMHGKTSQVHHDGVGVFEGLPNPMIATRYHSLVVLRESVPADGWAVSAWTRDVLDTGKAVEVVMGLRRMWVESEKAKDFRAPTGREGSEKGTRGQAPVPSPLVGVQFHPESFLTAEGPSLLANFLGLPRSLAAKIPSDATPTP